MRDAGELPFGSKTFIPREDRLARLIEQQCRLQKSLGFDVSKYTLPERLEYIKDMMHAINHELVEAMNEMTWKPWTTAPPSIDPNTFFGELRDAWQFLTNMMWAAFPYASGAQLADVLEGALDTKTMLNLRRHREGYDGKKDKCPGCKRALDDTGVACYRRDEETIHCVRTKVNYTV